MKYKSEADYVDETKSTFRKCKDCKMFRQPDKCSLVRGNINPAGSCRFWEFKSKLPVER